MLEQLPSLVMTATAILTLDDLGLGHGCNLDQASRKLAERSEAQIVRWVQFPAGALFFTLVPGDPESGAVYVFDRKTGVFYLIEFTGQKMRRPDVGRVRDFGAHLPPDTTRATTPAAETAL